MRAEVAAQDKAIEEINQLSVIDKVEKLIRYGLAETFLTCFKKGLVLKPCYCNSNNNVLPLAFELMIVSLVLPKKNKLINYNSQCPSNERLLADIYKKEKFNCKTIK